MTSINGITELITKDIINNSKPMDLSSIIHTTIDEKCPMENEMHTNKPIENEIQEQEQKQIQKDTNLVAEMKRIQKEMQLEAVNGNNDSVDTVNNSLVNDNNNSDTTSDLSDIEENIDVVTHVNININNENKVEEEIIHPLILDCDDKINMKDKKRTPPEMDWNKDLLDLNDEMDSKKEKEMLETETVNENKNKPELIAKTILKKTDNKIENEIIQKELHTYKK
eukprot:364641_1